MKASLLRRLRFSATLTLGLSLGFLSMPTQPAEAAVVGGVDVNGWCKSTFNLHQIAGARVLDGGNAYSWRCTYAWGAITAWSVDMNAACKRTYGSSAWATLGNSRDPYSWRCNR